MGKGSVKYVLVHLEPSLARQKTRKVGGTKIREEADLRAPALASPRVLCGLPNDRRGLDDRRGSSEALHLLLVDEVDASVDDEQGVVLYKEAGVVIMTIR
jgi:hypothetical protein